MALFSSNELRLLCGNGGCFWLHCRHGSLRFISVGIGEGLGAVDSKPLAYERFVGCPARFFFLLCWFSSSNLSMIWGVIGILLERLG